MKRASQLQANGPGDPPSGSHIPRKIIKGGLYLCAPSYCLRYRPAARQPQMTDTSMSHLGFRCIIRPQPAELNEHGLDDRSGGAVEDEAG